MKPFPHIRFRGEIEDARGRKWAGQAKNRSCSYKIMKPKLASDDFYEDEKYVDCVTFDDIIYVAEILYTMIFGISNYSSAFYVFFQYGNGDELGYSDITQNDRL